MKKRNQSYLCIFKKWEIEIAENMVSKITQQMRLLRYGDSEDLMQECLIRWLQFRAEYDPEKMASKKTYMRRIIENHLINLYAKAKAEKRKAFAESCSLDEELEDDYDVSTLHEIVGFHDKNHQRIFLKDDLPEVFQKLTPQQVKLCKFLIHHDLDIKKACSLLRRHQSNIYREIKRIREVFIQEGLTRYWK